MSLYNQDPEYSIDNEIIERFNNMSQDALYKCLVTYVRNYDQEPNVYGNYLSIVIPPLYYKDLGHINRKAVTNLIINMLPLKFVQYVLTIYGDFILDSITIDYAFKNPDQTVITFILTNKQINYNTHCNMIDSFMESPAFAQQYFDILFKKFNAIPITSAIINETFTERYSNFLDTFNIKITKRYRDTYYVALFLEKSDTNDITNIKTNEIYEKGEYDIDDETIRNFGTMTKDGLHNLLDKYIGIYNDDPITYKNYIIVAMYYYFKDNIYIKYPIITYIIATLPLDLVKYTLLHNPLFKVMPNIVYSALQNKDRDVIKYILTEYELDYNTHYYIIGQCVYSENNSLFSSVYNLLFTRYNEIVISKQLVDTSFITKYEPYLKNRGITIVKTMIDNINFRLSLKKEKDISKCMVHDYIKNSKDIEMININELLKDYSNIKGANKGDKYYTYINGNYILYEIVAETKTYYPLGYVGLFSSEYEELTTKKIKKIYVI